MGGYLKSFLILVFIMILLLHLIPGKTFQKYVRFFSEILLTIGILSPVLSVICDSDSFMQKIEYEEFTENITEIAKDMERMEYIQNDYFKEEYETAIGTDVRETAEKIASEYGYRVTEAKVHLTDEYQVDTIAVTLSSREEGDIVVEDISIGKQKVADYIWTDENGMVAEMKRALAEYYQLSQEQITIT